MEVKIYVVGSKPYVFDTQNIYAKDFIDGMNLELITWRKGNSILMSYFTPKILTAFMLEIYKKNIINLNDATLERFRKSYIRLYENLSKPELAVAFGKKQINEELEKLIDKTSAMLQNAVEDIIPFTLNASDTKSEKQNLTYEEALVVSSEGNFITHESLESFESMHMHEGYLYCEDGICLEGIRDFLEHNKWATKGWRIKYTADQVNAYMLEEMHKLGTQKMLKNELSFEDCIIHFKDEGK